jgi:hypothetical protein
MKRILSVIFSAVFGLTSCSTWLPEHIATVNVDAITFAILTELYCAASDLKGQEQTLYFASDDYWVAGIDMYLSASIEASANPAVSLLGPFNLAKAVPVGGTVGSFTSVFSGSVDETRTNLREYKIYVYLKRLVQGYTDPVSKKTVPDWKTFAEQNRWPVHCENPNAGGTFLQGQLGLEDWLAPAVITQEASVRYAPLNAPPAPPSTPPPPTPTVTDVFPRTGSEKDAITITGSNLDKVTKLFLGNQQIAKSNYTATATTIKFHPPVPLATTPPGPANVTVEIDNGTDSGATATLTSAFAYVAPPPPSPAESATERAPASLAQSHATVSPPSGAQQGPTIGGTFTFTIKSTGTIGPTFTLTRVSGGASNLFTAQRTDNSYVIIGLTAAYYCPLSTSLPAPGTCAPTTTTTTTKTTRSMQTTLMTQIAQPREPNADQLSAAIYRIDAAILNQNLAKIAAP